MRFTNGEIQQTFACSTVKRTFVLLLLPSPSRRCHVPRKGPKKTGERAAKGEATRRAAIARTLKIASAQGLAAVTWGRLARDLRMSKSGLFAHFRSTRALELATIERAREVFAMEVLLPAEDNSEGIERLWYLCHRWLQHFEEQTFPGSYFFTGALFLYAPQSGPVPDAIRGATKEWFMAMKRAVEQAQKQGEIEREADAKQTAFELNGLLVGAHWAHLLGDQDAFKEARAAVLRKLHPLATEEIPAKAFESVRAFRGYLKNRHG